MSNDVSMNEVSNSVTYVGLEGNTNGSINDWYLWGKAPEGEEPREVKMVFGKTSLSDFKYFGEVNK